MIEAHGGEVEKVLLYIGDARNRARAAADRIEGASADAHVVEALRDAERELGILHKRLTQQTFYSVTDTDIRLSV